MSRILPLLAGLALLPGAQAAVTTTTLVNWNHTWAFMHPMGQLPNRPAGGADTDFNTTWYLPAATFATTYDGPTFGISPRQNGVPGTPASYDSGSGPGPIGYDVMNYFTTPGAEFTANGTTLTIPNSPNRYTAYFRATFNVPSAGMNAPKLRYITDDGAYVYIDGVLRAAINVPGTAGAYTTLALNTTQTEDILRELDLSVAGTQGNAVVYNPFNSLSVGSHTLAVAVHNAANNSSDIGLAMHLRATFGCDISPVVQNLTRNINGTPSDSSDDTFSFQVLVNGVGSVGPGWTSTRHPVTGAYQAYNGSYGATISYGPFSIFDSPFQVQYTDTADPTCTASITATVPGCSITASVAGNPVYDDRGTPATGDDQFSIPVVVNAQYGSTTFDCDYPPYFGDYGSPIVMGPFPVYADADAQVDPVTVTFSDFNDQGCAAVLVIHPPVKIGNCTVPGVNSALITEPVENIRWVAGSNPSGLLLTLTLNNASDLGLNTRRTVPLDLSPYTSGPKRIRGGMVFTDSSTGSNFETDDRFRLVLETFDGTTTSQTVISAGLDKNNSGYVNGHTNSGAQPYDSNRGLDEFNTQLLPMSGTINSSNQFQIILAPAVRTARLIVEGDNDSSSESFQIRDLLVDLPFCELTATAGPSVLNNQGDSDPANDTWTAPVTIRSVYTPGSTGWTSDATPASGLYSAAQPVIFGPFPIAQSSRVITITDAAGGSGCSAVVTVNAPACSINAVASDLQRQENGPGVEDDTFTFKVMVTGVNAGTGWVSDSTPSSGSNGVLTQFGPFPAEVGTIQITFQDAANPSCLTYLFVDPPPRYILGVVDFGFGPNRIASDFALPLAGNQWVNDPSRRTLFMNNGGSQHTVESEWIDLNPGFGPLNLSATFSAWDNSNGSNFEAEDTFRVDLRTVAGGVTNTMTLTAPYDIRTVNGYINGFTAADATTYNNNAFLDEFNRNSQTAQTSISNNFPLATVLADNVTAAKLIITGRNDSTSEFFRFGSFTIMATQFDRDGDFMEDGWETTHFGHTAFTGGMDNDEDGSTNYEEYVAGTSPTLANSVLKASPPTVAGSNFTLVWSSVVGRKYQVEFTPSPLRSNSVWQNVGAVLTATGTTSSRSGTLPSTTAGHLRVRVVP